MKLLHLLWIPLAYRFSPLWLGQHSLRGFLKQQGVDILGIPLQASMALAEDAYKFHRFNIKLRRLGLFSAMADYTESLELTALQVRTLLHEPDRSSEFLASCYPQKEILERFGIAVPPVFVDRNNQTF